METSMYAAPPYAAAARAAPNAPTRRPTAHHWAARHWHAQIDPTGPGLAVVLAANARGGAVRRRAESTVVSTPETRTLPSDELLAESLKKRQEELQKQRPKRFVVRTMRGFLNVHTEPGDPFRADNVVGQLLEGQIVTGLQEKGDWVYHDAGGWSIRFHGGFEWLRPLEESEGPP